MSTPADRKARIQAAAPRQRSILPWLAAALVLVLLAGGITWALLSKNKDDSAVAKAAANVTAPPNANADKSGIVVVPGKAKAGAPVVAMFQDYQCPICKTVEASVGSTLEKAAEEGQIKLEYHTMTFLDGNLKNDSSTRAAQAAACADVVGAYSKYHDTVYANQPEVEGAGYTDKQLTEDFPKGAGITGDKLVTFQTCYKDKKLADWVVGTNDKAGKAGVTGTPTFMVNGKALTKEQMATWQQPDTFLATILAAAK